MRAIAIASAIVATVAMSAAALAADIAPVYKAPPPAVTTYSWTGWYIGGHAGYGWGDHDVTISHNDQAFFGPAFGAGATPSLYNPNFDGFIGGAQIGFNWQTGAWVFGIEGDISYSDMKGTQNIDTSVPGFSVGFGTASQDLNWLATIRGRVGYAWNNVLVYGTGGVAFGDVDYRYNFAFPQTAENYNVSTSKTQTGFAVGGGIEYGIGAWSFKVEYIYFDLGGGATYAATAIGAPGSSTHFATFDDTQGHIVRGGINYRFNWGKTPVVAKY